MTGSGTRAPAEPSRPHFPKTVYRNLSAVKRDSCKEEGGSLLIPVPGLLDCQEEDPLLNADHLIEFAETFVRGFADRFATRWVRLSSVS